MKDAYLNVIQVNYRPQATKLIKRSSIKKQIQQKPKTLNG
ncbi:hypothetical protein AXX16_3877 [Serratia rubidaea]|nr:hypothetical protein AXX16_3877 [Serratia rubidaea]